MSLFSQNRAQTVSWKWQNTTISPKFGSNSLRIKKPTSPSFTFYCCSSSVSLRPLRYAVLGAGFAGLSVAWHLLKHSSEESDLSVDIYDEIGIGGGASGVAGGLLHPYSPKVKLLWKGAECWKESLNLISIAEAALVKLASTENQGSHQNGESSIIRRRGIIRPAVTMKNMNIMTENAQDCLRSCRIEFIHKDNAQHLLPDLSLPLNLAFHMPEALNINSQCYLEALYLACQHLAKDVTMLGNTHRNLSFHKRSIENLQELGEYDAVIICLGARTAFLPELEGRLPLRTCRGVIAQLKLPDDIRKSYPQHSPSILSDAWLAVQGARELHLGSTWEWKSTNYARDVPSDEASNAMEALLPKASAVYPAIKDWTIFRAVAGLRAMPPLTEDGSLPLLGCVDEYVGRKNHSCKYWLFTGLGARGLFYHAWLGKLVALAVLSHDENLIPCELTSWKVKVKR